MSESSSSVECVGIGLIAAVLVTKIAMRIIVMRIVVITLRLICRWFFRTFFSRSSVGAFSIITPGFDLLFLVAKTFGSLLAATLGLLLSKTSGFLLNVVNIDVSILSSHFLCTAAPAWWSNALARTTTRWLTWDNDYQEVCTLIFLVLEKSPCFHKGWFDGPIQTLVKPKRESRQYS